MTVEQCIRTIKLKECSANFIGSGMEVNRRTVLTCIARATEAWIGYPFPEIIRKRLYQGDAGL